MRCFNLRDATSRSANRVSEYQTFVLFSNTSLTRAPDARRFGIPPYVDGSLFFLNHLNSFIAQVFGKVTLAHGMLDRTKEPSEEGNW
jgi:hypothetical protein